MAARLFEAMRGGSPAAAGSGLLRLDPLATRAPVDQVTFSGGVAEYIYGREAQTYGDLGVLLAQEIRTRVEGWGPRLERAHEGIRATVIGASQYTTQVSGSTIYVSPLEALPLRNVPVIAPAFALDAETIDPGRGRGGDQDGAAAARPRRSGDAGGGVRTLAGLGDIPAARRFLPRRGRRTCRRCSRAATRWCWRATATSAA